MAQLSRAAKRLLNKTEGNLKEEKPIMTASFDDLVDIVQNDHEPKFLTFEGEIYSERQIDNKLYIPPQHYIWLLPRAENVLEEYKKHSDTTDRTGGSDSKMVGSVGCNYCDKELYPLLVDDYFPRYSQMPSVYHYHYLTWVALSSYLVEKLNYSPIVYMVSNTGRGKTPTLKALCHISRRGIFTESFREANIIRWARDYQASLFFDITNFAKKVDMHDAEDLIYGRAERGVITARVLHPEKGAFEDMEDFEPFGVTGATSNRNIDNITAERCSIVHMPFSKNIYPYPNPKESLPIKEKLTAFRMAHFNTPLIDIKKGKAGKLEDYLLDYHKIVKTFFPSHEKDFLEFKNNYQEDKFERTQGSFEARMLLLVESLKDYVEEGSLCLTYEDLVNTYNEDKEKKLDTVAMSSIVRKIGFTPKRNKSHDKRGIFYDEDLIDNLKELYGIPTTRMLSDPPPPSETSEKLYQTATKIFGGDNS